MARSQSPPPRPARVRPAAEGVLALAGAAALGAAAASWTSTLQRGFGQAPDTVTTLGIVGVLALVVGAYLDFRPPSGRGPRPGRAAGWKLAATGAITAVAAGVAPFVPAILVWTGADATAPAWGVTLARAAVGALLLLPAGVTAGAAVRAAVRELPEGESARAVLAGAVPAAAVGALAAGWLEQAAGPGATAAGAAGLLAAVGLVAVALHPGRHNPSLAPEAGSDRSSAWAAGAAAFGLAAFSFLTARALVPTFGNDLPGLPVARPLFVVGLAGGGLLAAVALRAARRRIPAGAPAAAAVLAALVALPTILFRFDGLPATFAEVVRSADAYGDVLQAAVRQAAVLATPVAVVLGLSVGLLLGGLPTEPRARPAWIARNTRAAAAGATIGLLLPRWALPSFGIADTVLLAAGLTAAAGAAAFVLAGSGRPARVASVVLVVAVAAFLIQRAPAPDRSALHVEASLVPASSLVSVIPKHWAVYDRDGVLDTVTLLKRGHSRRLLRNGRFEAGHVSEIKSHGLLLHLPLVLQAAPKRVGLLGSGNGRSIAAALSHPVSGVDVFLRDRAVLGALRRFSPD
ncbi:MAG TPA: hypothetical protein VKU85_02500, partial [bacterium]|nr:hypothetical protein [bacterium]